MQGCRGQVGAQGRGPQGRRPAAAATGAARGFRRSRNALRAPAGPLQGPERGVPRSLRRAQAIHRHYTIFGRDVKAASLDFYGGR